MKTVGLHRRSYLELRNIILPNEGLVRFVDVASDFSTAPSVLQEWRERVTMMRFFSAAPVPDEPIDCYHFFNTLPLKEVPFVCTFETELPRWYGVPRDVWRQGLEILAAAPCRRIFALSEDAADYMRRRVLGFGEQLAGAVLPKLEVLYPPQSVPADDKAIQKFTQTVLDVAFVGRDFLRKGGYEVMLAMGRVLRRGLPVRLHIVSPMSEVAGGADMPWGRDTDAKLARCEAIAAAFPEQIARYPSLSNEEVMNLFERCHVHVLPSFQDTFGFSVLEAQSRRCPTITTRQRAFPEVNTESSGWLIGPSFRIDDLQRDDGEAFAILSDLLVEEIAGLLSELALQGCGSIRSKAEAAFERIRLFHDPARTGETIAQYY